MRDMIGYKLYQKKVVFFSSVGYIYTMMSITGLYCPIFGRDN